MTGIYCNDYCNEEWLRDIERAGAILNDMLKRIEDGETGGAKFEETPEDVRYNERRVQALFRIIEARERLRMAYDSLAGAIEMKEHIERYLFLESLKEARRRKEEKRREIAEKRKAA